MTRDLRRQVLESHKTVSKKAQLRMSSRTCSAANSRTASRTASDEEDGNLSDSTTWSSNSLDDLVPVEVPDDPGEIWKQILGDRIEEIIDRTRSSVWGRETALAAYNSILMQRFAYAEIVHKTEGLFSALLKSVKAESSEKETCLALRAIGLTLITVPSDNSYDGLFQTLKRVYTTSEYPNVKAAAIHTLSAAAIYGSAGDSEIEEIMDDYLEIIESDGESVDAADIGAVVVSAIEAWGYLATMMEDMEEKSETAMEAFVEQLDSSDPTVQLAAGENIALLYEKSWTPREVDDGPVSMEYDEEGYALESGYVQRYEVYRQKSQLQHILLRLSKESSKRLAKKDRKQLHTTFADILTTVEHPPRGPRYSKAISNTGERYGSRMYMKLGDGKGIGMINKWWKLQRLQALRRILGGGFTVHYARNEVVFESLPVIFVQSRLGEAGGGR